jgi:hypothetical protein
MSTRPSQSHRENADCAEIRPLLSALVDGEASPEEAARAEKHLSLCDPCTSHLAFLRTAAFVIQRNVEAPSSLLFERIAQATYAKPVQPTWRERIAAWFRPAPTRWAMGTALAAGIVAAVILPLGNQRLNEIASAPVATPSAATPSAAAIVNSTPDALNADLTRETAAAIRSAAGVVAKATDGVRWSAAAEAMPSKKTKTVITAPTRPLESRQDRTENSAVAAVVPGAARRGNINNSATNNTRTSTSPERVVTVKTRDAAPGLKINRNVPEPEIERSARTVSISAVTAVTPSRLESTSLEPTRPVAVPSAPDTTARRSSPTSVAATTTDPNAFKMDRSAVLSEQPTVRPSVKPKRYTLEGAGTGPSNISLRAQGDAIRSLNGTRMSALPIVTGDVN